MNTNTSALFEQVIDKLRDEMAANAKDGAIEVIGEFLTALIRANPEHAEKIMEEKKTIKGAMEAMKTEAAKHKNDNVACLDFCAGIRVVLEYYGLPAMHNCQMLAVMEQAAGAISTPTPEEKHKPAKPEPVRNTDEFDLDALLDELG